MKSIKGYGCKLVYTEIEDYELLKVYQGANFTFEIRTYSMDHPDLYKRPPFSYFSIYFNTNYGFKQGD